MDITIPSDMEAFVRERATTGGFGSVELYVSSLIQQDEAELAFREPLTEEQLAETLAMIDRGMADVAAGRTMPAREALRQVADEFGLKLER